MNNTSKLLAWVNCYGAWDPQLRHPVETIGYNQYLDGVTNAVATQSGRIAAVHLSGGMRDQNGRTECQTTATELASRLAVRGVTGLTFKLDETSVSSITIARQFLTTWQSDYPDTSALLFCDQVRYPTNAYVLTQLALELGLTLPPAGEILVPIPRLDIHPNSTPEKQAVKLKKLHAQGIAAIEAAELTERRQS